MSECEHNYDWVPYLAGERIACTKCGEPWRKTFVETINELAALKRELSEAAMLINCAGPVSHRIKVLKKEYGEQYEKLEAEVAALKGELAEYKEVFGAQMDQRKTYTINEQAYPPKPDEAS